ncbi:MAG: SipW-dependent-type signal peptide-containing protein [Clostridiales bacterium]|nr:SipW-dependent-type signal peptide-containing protein [Clostridiales bacterium]
MKKKTLTIAIALVLVVALAVGATYAYLTAKTQTVTNTFTAGGAVAANDLTLKEHVATPNPDGSYTLSDTNYVEEGEGNSYVVLPGVNLPKDPTVTVEKSTGTYYLFVTVEKGSGFTGENAPLSYTTASDWESMTISGNDVENKELYVYSVTTDGTTTYIQPKSNTPVFHAILAGIVGDTSNTIEVSDGNAALQLGDNGSELKFTAYACQSAGFATPAAAWNGAFKQATGITAA